MMGADNKGEEGGQVYKTGGSVCKTCSLPLLLVHFTSKGRAFDVEMCPTCDKLRPLIAQIEGWPEDQDVANFVFKRKQAKMKGVREWARRRWRK